MAQLGPPEPLTGPSPAWPWGVTVPAAPQPRPTSHAPHAHTSAAGSEGRRPTAFLPPSGVVSPGPRAPARAACSLLGSEPPSARTFKHFWVHVPWPPTPQCEAAAAAQALVSDRAGSLSIVTWRAGDTELGRMFQGGTAQGGGREKGRESRKWGWAGRSPSPERGGRAGKRRAPWGQVVDMEWLR